ncbi:tricarboxylate transporter, partial [Phaeobacter sp. HF9A]|nr:tricarboxylate transporter [Phaeobacter sp. HF9A]
ATDGCETSGEAWDAWKAFFVAGFPVQKIAFLPAGTPDDVAKTFADAFDAVRNREDFATIASKRVGKYEVFVGAGAEKATKTGTTVSPEAKAYVQNWLQDSYGVSLK